MSNTIILGAVAYDPKVVTIWDGFKAWFTERGLEFDYILYENYERQVESHFMGHYNVAWNSPLAWLQAKAIAEKLGQKVESIAMRDTDCDLTSVIVVRADSGIADLEGLRGKVIGVGASDSPQATLIPLEHLSTAGLSIEKDIDVRRFDILVGKHGDHIGGERAAAVALMQGEVDAACMIDGNHLLFGREGTLPSGTTHILSQTGEYDHCNFTVLGNYPKKQMQTFKELLLSMRYDDPIVRPLLDLEGLKVWKEGRSDHYGLLENAIARFGTIDSFVNDVAKRCLA